MPSSKGLKFAGFSLILTMKIPCLRVSQSLTESQQTLQKLCDEALFFCFLYFTLICFDPKSQDLPRPTKTSQELPAPVEVSTLVFSAEQLIGLLRVGATQ